MTGFKKRTGHESMCEWKRTTIRALILSTNVDMNPYYFSIFTRVKCKRLLLLTSIIIHLNDTPGVNMRRTISKHTAINAEPHMNHQLHHKRLLLLANAKTSMILMTAMVASNATAHRPMIVRKIKPIIVNMITIIIPNR